MTDGVTTNTHSPTELGRYQKPGPEAALISPSAYYRSKVLNVNHGVNPLVGAASSIFSILNQCQHLPPETDLRKLQQEFVHEIFSFECVSQSNTFFQEKIILAARYALCAFIDESVQHALGEHHATWQPYLMLKRFHGQEWGGQQFYVLLERASADPKGYIDLLELFYLCLALGYQGKYSNSDQGYLIRENITNKLYQCIREQRGEFSRNIMVGDEQQTINTTPKKRISKGVLAISLIAMLSVAGIVVQEYFTVQNTNNAVQQAMFNLLHSQLNAPTDFSLSRTR